MLIEDTIIPTEALPLDAFRDHLRMGTGFAEDTLQDGLLERHLRAAIAAIEARTGKILLSRLFNWSVRAWQAPDTQPLPVAPVRSVSGVTLVDRQGDETVANPALWLLMVDAVVPSLVAPTGSLPAIPSYGRARISFEAGYGPDWDDIPGDLSQATFLLAGHFYEFRHAAEGRGVDIPRDIASLIAPHRAMRLSLGGRRP